MSNLKVEVSPSRNENRDSIETKANLKQKLLPLFMILMGLFLLAIAISSFTALLLGTPPMQLNIPGSDYPPLFTLLIAIVAGPIGFGVIRLTEVIKVNSAGVEKTHAFGRDYLAWLDVGAIVWPSEKKRIQLLPASLDNGRGRRSHKPMVTVGFESLTNAQEVAKAIITLAYKNNPEVVVIDDKLLENLNLADAENFRRFTLSI